MAGLSKQTKSVTPDKVVATTYVLDGEDKVLGRLATRIANLLMGKDSMTFIGNVDCPNIVIVINADKIKVTGRKEDQKTYGNYSGYPGGLKIKSYSELKAKGMNKVVSRAVSGMLPKNKHRDARIKRLYVYSGSEHPFTNTVIAK